MPTQIIAGDDGTYTLFANTSGDPALLVSGSRNRFTLWSDYSSLSGGPAVVFTGADNYLYNQGGTISSSGGIALQGSDFYDEIFNGSTIVGDVHLGGGDDHFQNNYASTVGQVFGGDGNDSLTTFQGSVQLAYFGEAGDDFLRGGSMGDELFGGSGADNLYGEGGNDQLTGGTDADRLVGGLGDDLLAGGGDEGDLAVFDGMMAGFDVAMADGAGTVDDIDSSDGDQGTDTLSGISILRFTDQEVDLRIARNELVVTTPGETYTNTIDRYGYFPVELRGDGATLVNEAAIRGTAVPHNELVEPYGYMAADTGAVALFVYNATIENRAGASIVSFDEAIGIVERPAELSGEGLQLINHGLIRSLESNAIQVYSLKLTNGATGVIESVGPTYTWAAIATPNGHATIVNAGLISGTHGSIQASILSLDNSGSIVGEIRSTYYRSRIDNSGSITGGYDAWGGLDLLNRGQSSGDLDIDVQPVGQASNQGFTYTRFENRGQFTGDIRISGDAHFNSAPPAHADYVATILNSGTLTGSIVSDPGLAPVGGATPDASFVSRSSTAERSPATSGSATATTASSAAESSAGSRTAAPATTA